MIDDGALSVADVGHRAALIFATVRSQSDLALWRAALGDATAPANAAPAPAAPRIGLDALLALFHVGAPAPRPPAAAVARSPAGATETLLGVNTAYTSAIDDAAQRTAIPASTLVAIIDAESAKHTDGSWRTDARNPRSSATGIGQFLAGTWCSEAERAGTWLNRFARTQGWIGPDGTVIGTARAALLALRHDGTASIHATADYAAHGLDRLAKAGIAVAGDVAAVTRTAYVGHNLGIADAIRFLRGTLGEGRAKHLLEAQVGSAKAAARIADAGSAVAAHRQWLGDFIARHVRSAQPGS